MWSFLYLCFSINGFQFMNEKQCIECNRTFFGRADKVFCSDMCRNSFNNRRNKESNNYIRNINSILKKNWKILSDHNPEGKAKIHKDKIVSKGFKFNYMTDQYVTKEGKKYIFCYDQGYLELDKGYLAIVKKKDYVTP